MKITLRAARVNAGVGQLEAAKAIGVNVATISRWENGQTVPNAKNFKALCELYRCPGEFIKLNDRKE